MVSKSRVDKASDRFAKGVESPDDLDVVRIFRDTRTPILKFFIDEISTNRPVEWIVIAGRVKRISSIIRKCRRERTRISALEDLVGYRVVVRDIAAQRLFRDGIASWSNAVRVRDYAAMPREDGYRAVHVVLEYEIDESTRGRIEVQIRTVWQHIWANASEGFGLAVKEGGGPEHVRRYLSSLSISMAALDEEGRLPTGWSVGTGAWGTPYLATFDARRRAVRSVTSFADVETALEALLVREKVDLLDAVLLLAESPSVIKLTHLGLFPRELVEVLAKVEPPLTGDLTKTLLTPAWN